jgi:hypothetical protein
MPKHLDDASRLCTERRALIQATRSQLDELGGKAKDADAKLGQLKSMGDLKGIAKQAAVVKKIAEDQVKAQKALDAALARQGLRGIHRQGPRRHGRPDQDPGRSDAHPGGVHEAIRQHRRAVHGGGLGQLAGQAGRRDERLIYLRTLSRSGGGV